MALGLGAAILLKRLGARSPWRTGIWAGAFVMLAVGAGLGAANHGLVLSDTARMVLWQPLNLSLAIAVVLVVTGAVHDWKGVRSARRVLRAGIAIPPLFWLVTWLGDFSFRAFVVFSAPAMVFSLAVYIGLAVRANGMAWAWWMAAGLALTIVASGIQASNAVSVTVVWPFDHNGVFHVVQAVGIVALVIGLWASYRAPGTAGTS